MRGLSRRAVLPAVVAAVALALSLSSNALAAEVSYNESVFARFANGHVGIVRISLEKNAAGEARAKVHVWCARPGAVKIACDAIRFSSSAGAAGLSVQKWSADIAKWRTESGQGLDVADPTPPVNGLEMASAWDCPGDGYWGWLGGWYGSYRATAGSFRAAANGQWSGTKTRVSRTYRGKFC